MQKKNVMRLSQNCTCLRDGSLSGRITNDRIVSTSNILSYSSATFNEVVKLFLHVYGFWIDFFYMFGLVFGSILLKIFFYLLEIMLLLLQSHKILLLPNFLFGVLLVAF